MARPLRLDFGGALHHVIARGNRKAIIFADDDDCSDFLTRLDRISLRLRWRVWAFCLMPNHFHLLVETPTPTLSRGMRDLNGGFAQYLNRRRDLVGHVFQGRYKALLVDREGYALQVVRYIVRNPIRAGLCQTLTDWRWSSHRATLGLASTPDCLASSRVLRFFGPPKTAIERYSEFVSLSAFDHDEPMPAGPNRSVVGGPDFLEAVPPGIDVDRLEHPRPDRLFKTLARYQLEHLDRDAAIRAAYEGGGFSQAAIARYFGLHYSTVCRVLRPGPRARPGTKRQDSRSDPT
ncbi:MAG TPA: transposase [Vicinamibacterales bacterium]|nr:transposase [Vicinamibacterales bacterium]